MGGGIQRIRNGNSDIEGFCREFIRTTGGRGKEGKRGRFTGRTTAATYRYARHGNAMRLVILCLLLGVAFEISIP